MTEPFLTTSDLTDVLPYDVTDDPGAVIAVDAACDIVRSIANQTFSSITDTVTLDGTGTDCLLLPEIPVLNAGTVIVGDGTGLTSGVDYVVSDGRALIRTGGAAYTTNVGIGDVFTWPLGRQNVSVTYDHGYATVPADVRAVALQVASRIVNQGIATSETVAGQSITFASPAFDLTPGERLILTRHRPY